MQLFAASSVRAARNPFLLWWLAPRMIGRSAAVSLRDDIHSTKGYLTGLDGIVASCNICYSAWYLPY